MLVYLFVCCCVVDSIWIGFDWLESHWLRWIKTVTKWPRLLHILSKLRPHTYDVFFKKKKKFAPNSYLSTLAFWISVVFLEHTISFWEALMRKTLSGKKRWRVSSTQLQIIFAWFALDLLAKTGHVVQPDYGAKQEILHVLCRNRGWIWLNSWILYWFFCFDDSGFCFGFHFAQMHSKST